MEFKKVYDNQAMLTVFQKLNRIDSSNVEYLHNLSYAYSRIGANLETEKQRMAFYAKAKRIATKAKNLDKNNWGPHYAYALALARENENAKTKQKIANAKEIRKACEKAIELNPEYAGSYHILGRWHRTFAGFSSIERGMVNTFYGGAPDGGSYKDAIEMFGKAIKLEPTYPLHIYEIAVTYHEMGKDDYAIKFLEKVVKMPASNTDFNKAIAKANKLLNDLQD